MKMIKNVFLVETQNGYFGWLLSQSTDSDHPKPMIHGSDDTDVNRRVPFHSGIFHLYVDPPQPADTEEVAYYPVQTPQTCYR